MKVNSELEKRNVACGSINHDRERLALCKQCSYVNFTQQNKAFLERKREGIRAKIGFPLYTFK